MKKYKWWVVGLILFITTINCFDNYFNVSFLLGNEFNLITINTVLVGFLFTIYTILIPLLDEEALKSYSITGEVDSLFNNITIGIQCGILSVIFTITGLLIFKTEKDIALSKIHVLWLIIEIAFFLLIFISTLLSIINITIIVEDVRKNKLKKINKQNNNIEMKNRFKNNRRS